MLAPTGVGVLYGKPDLLEQILPPAVGGEMVLSVDREHFTQQQIPIRLEAGTPNVMGVLGLGAAIEYLNSVGMQNVQEHCQMLGQKKFIIVYPN